MKSLETKKGTLKEMDALIKETVKSNSSVFDDLKGFISNDLVYVYSDVNVKIYFEQIFGKLIFKLQEDELDKYLEHIIFRITKVKKI